MERQLRQIYVDVSEGRLSRQEALERIRVLKLQEQAESSLLLATPVWEAADASVGDVEYAERHVIVCEPAAGDENVAQRYGRHALACFERIRTILQAKPQGKVLVQIVVDEHETGLSALLKTAALENPQIVGELIVAGGRQVLRWQEIPPGPEKPPVAFENGGVYLITGGLGGLGVLFAEEILGQTSDARVVLTGRGAKRDLLDDARVSYRQLNVCDPDQVEQLIAAVIAEHGRLDGILHCAGMLADNFILKKTAAEFRDVLAPKVTGTFHLDQATKDLDLDFFVLFSSIAGAMGNVGQADYAAANGFLDQFAVHRNRLVAAGQRHGRTRSINWPLWEAGGMGADPATAELLQQATGMQPMRTATGMDVFHRALALPHDQLLVAEGDLAQIRRALHGRQPAESSSTAAAPPDEGKTEDYLRRQCAELLKLPFQAIDPQAPLEQYGIDSLLAMRLTNHLEKTFGTLSKTLFFECQTIRELAGYFAQSHAARLAALFGQAEPLPPARSKRRHHVRRKAAEEPIAIIGLSGRYPEAVDIEAYWENLRDGRDCIVEVPKERWDWREYYSEDRTEGGRHYSKWGGFIAGVDEFDPLFFGISPREAKLIDPQERLFLQHAWMAVEDAGYTRAGLQVPRDQDLPGQVGVYAGVMYTEYQLFGGPRLGINNSAASIANRVSYALNLHGPSLTLDTMCSSSLTAIHFACLDLKLGRTDLAIAGGVNVSIHPSKYLMLSAGQFISGEGHCQSFGEGGDGYIPGEGVGVVLLKRLSDAERDGDHVYGVIRGSALNHGGKTNGYTVPNPQAQATAISRALAESHTDARHISYIEAHGTGTKLGDPIEIAALGKAFQRDTRDTAFCLIGSAKSNIGHCESAAGIAGLTKVLLQIKHQQIAPSLHSAQLNPHIDFENTPFVVNQALRPWEQPVIDGRKLPRIAGISSFGAGGSNAHLIIEEHEAPAAQPIAGKMAILLSARTAEQLEQKARDLLRFVASGTPDLAAMAYTLHVGREAMDERLGIVVSSVEQLAEKLQAYVDGRQGIEDVHRGRRNRETRVHAADGLQVSELVDLWVKGLELDWSRLHGQVRPRRMSLPTYPFARERFWVEIEAAKAPAAAVLHPLLHRNTSDLAEQSYSSTFSGDEFFLRQPAAAYLEMARAAVQKASRHSAETILELRDVVWGQPVAIAGKTDVSIALLANDGERIDFEIHTGEIVHCQGRAVLSGQPAPPPLDVAQLALTRLRLPESLKETAGDYVLHPALMNAALALSGRQRPPSALDMLRIVAPCSGDMFASVRQAADKVDIDLCDDRGHIAVQLRGLAWRAAAPAQEITEPVARKKPSAISLSAPSALVPIEASASRAAVTLPDAAPAARLHDRGNGVFSIEIGPATDAKQALESAQREPAIKVLMLSGIEHGFVGGGQEEYELLQLLAAFPYPVIAVMPRDVIGVGFAAAALCDVMVCSEDAHYGESPSTGTQLRAEGWTCPILPPARVEAYAQELAATLAAKPQDALRLLKQHLSRHVVEALKSVDAAFKALPDLRRVLGEPRGNAWLSAQYCDAEQQDEAAQPLTAPAPIALRSTVVTATAHPDGIVVVKMEDREAKNMFSEALVEGIAEAFAHIDQSPAYKVVILTGYDDYFASGGTKESLLAIQEGRARFTDVSTYQTALDCRLPVIAAMQGHGIGAGWTLGMFADLPLLSAESRYVSPYMNYGFTPGAGATYILGETIGPELARESLLTARPYTGRELEQRGIRIPVLPREEVLPAAMALARRIAQAPRDRLIALKQQLTAHMREPLEETYRLELAMHEQTFVGRPDTLARIETNFHQPASPQSQPERVDGDALPAVTATLRALLAAGLQMRESDIDDDAQFTDLGLDSVAGVSWIRRINDEYQISIEATRIYSYPTLAQLSRFVKEEVERRGALPAADAKPAVDVPPPAERLTSFRGRKKSRLTSAPAAQRIAVIGMAGQFPQANDLEEFWRNLVEGRNCIGEVPRNRWDLHAFHQAGEAIAGKTNCSWAGMLDGYDLFDPLFFNISPTEAESMDPQQRLFLQACWHGIEHAGYAAQSLSGSKCGVFVGCATNGEYHQPSRQHQLSAQGFTGSAMSILAARISYLLNLQGPCISIDTACSSSLIAIAQACDSLVSGDSDAALAGGVYVMVGPEMHIKTSQTGMLSPEGRCFTFDQRADGFVPGEGVGVVMLKRLADAERDGDTIYAVIEGWGVNQDGKTNGITAPNPDSQTRLEQAVYDKYRIDPAGIQLIETHGTGTKLGDPIEVDGLKNAFAKYTQHKSYCALGSVKSNIGHTLTAAGVAGVIKLVLALQHRQLPPTINFERLNEHIDLDDSPFYVNTRLQDWTVDGATRRQAAISSFGFSGTNAHMVIGEYQPAAIVKRPSHAGGDQIIPLSARTAAQLREKACDLLDFLRKEGRSLDLFDVAYTLQAGREPMDERLGLLVSSVEQLIEKLQAYVDGEQVGGLYEGQVRRNDETLSIISQDDDTKDALLERWISRRKLSKVLELWVNGLDLDWNRLHGEVKPRRIPLPLYPFAKEHYWIEATDAAATAVLHPLLHRNTSDFHRQSYRSTLRGDEFFLTDHQVRTGGNGIEKLLPGMAYLEMARAAIEHASGSNVMELQDTFWAQPIIVRESTEVTIALAADDSGRIDYEICSRDGDEEVVHFQGRASVSHRPAPAKLDLERLKTEMTHGRVEPGALYAACAHMGLMYGPAFHGVAAIHRGTDQVLAELRLPPSLESTVGDYFLHPSLMDSAVQAAAALVDGDVADEPRLPFALQSLSVFAPCSAEMVAWVRLAPGSRALDSTVKLDIDVCDVQGSVCVQLHGLSLRVSSPGQTAGSLPAIPIEQPESVANQELRQIYVDLSEGRLSRNEALERIKSFKLQQPAEGAGSLLATPVWEAADVQPSGGFAYAERHLIMCEAAAGDRDLAQRYGAHALACFERIRTILQAKPRAQVLVQIVVRDHEEQVLLTGLSALLATAALENPQLVGQLIVIPAGMSAEEMGRRLEEEKRGAANALVRYGQGGRQVRRWQEVPADPAKPPAAFEDRGVYLITGGLGGLGVLFAKEILRQTSDARVVLTGRGPEKRALLDGLGGRVSYRTVDVADRDQVEQLIAAIEQEHGRLNGILHCAGMLADNFIVKKDGAEFRNVLAPKVSGTFHLDEATRDLKLDFFVLFSSIAGAMGNVGQADYAAANGFMDQFAAYRNRLVGAGERHGRTRSINWPLWEAGGMGADAATAELLQQATGMQPMSTASGIDAFHRALAWPYDQLLVAEGDLARIRRALHAGRPAHTEPSVPAIAPVDGLVERTEEYLRRQCAELLKLPFQTIDPRAPLEKYGIDSILAMKLTGHLEKTFGSLSKTLFFEYQTIRELAGYFAQSHAPRLAALFGQPEAPAPVQSKPAAARRFAGRTREIRRERADEPVAIIGLSGRYPEAVDVEAYWNNLRDGKDCIIEVPKERWEWREYFSEDRSESGRHYSKWGGFIAGVDEFDALFFNISPKEAKGIDPQERLFLQHAWMAVEDAGYTRAGLQVPYESDLPGQVGVYAGVMYTEYQLFGAEARIGVAGSGASIANRVSYALNLHGPSMTLDTMCSSSLTAIHVACQDLKLGRTSLAIAGGVNVSIHPNKYLVLSGGQFISSDGRCESFGEGGDGYIPGEGVGVVLLKRLSDAERDGDHIYGVIRGSALNHGGKTNGYTVPNPQAQATAISRALAESHTDARHISYIEAHGTGTKLGDPIEIAALGKAFQRDTRETAFCLIGSAKSNIGHCESAAGIAGLTKVLLQIKHQQIAPSLHSAQLNPHIDFESTPFVVNQSLRPWEQPVIDGRTLPRIAGISSFGAGGSNAHLIVEEYQAPAAEPVAAGKVLILLSARTAEQLRQKAVDLLRFVASGTPELAAMAYTLQVGREAMEERLAVVIGTAEELREKLRAWVAGEQGIEDVHQGQVKRGNESLSAFSTDADLQQTVDKWIANGKLSKVADLWVKGLEVDWSKSHGDVQPRRVSLPAYPFARERHWVDVPAAAPAVVKSAAVLHPLLHSNTSVLGEQRYRSTFDGDEPFLTAEKVFPADTYLEMARAAIEHAVPERAESTFVELHDVSFGQPIVIEKDTRIEIALTPGDGDEIEFDIYSEDTILCQGRALFSRAPAPAEVVKPVVKKGPIALAAPTERKKPPVSPAGRAPITLSDRKAAKPAANGIFSIHVASATELRQALDRMRQEPALKVLMLSGLGRAHVEQGLYEAIASFPYPVIAVLQEDAIGAGFMAAALCDFMVCSEEATYGYADHPTATEAALLGERFGPARARDLVDVMTGRQLREKGWTCPIVAPPEVEATARKLASALAAKPRHALGLLKRHLMRRLVALAAAGTPAEQVETRTLAAALQELASADQGDHATGLPTPVPLRSRVITATAHPEGIVVVKMEDRDAKNMFSDAFMEGMREAFAHIEQTPAYKVVILTGYDSYFASGGTKENLRAVQEGKAKFTDFKIFQLPLDCSLPVIAAIQGHGIGAGWTLGMFADLVLLSEESQYVSPYMGYGFTPGAGATWILGEKMGQDLARESLLTAEPFTGRELAARGLALPVLPRAEVYPAAMALAGRIARTSRERLIDLKRELTRHQREALEETYRLELAMHEETFVGRPDTLAQIESKFQAPQPRAEAPQPPPASRELLPDVTATLRTLLAAELQLRESDVDDNAQFIDLGLDSVSGISWIRKINEKYRTALEPTKVYTYATLAQFSKHVAEEAKKQEAPPPPAVAPAAELPAAAAALTRRSRKPRRVVTSAPPSRATEPIAIIGMAGQFPRAKSVKELWRNVAEGRNCITEVPRQRWNADDYYQAGGAAPGKTNSRWMGALDECDVFDPLFFNISPTEAEVMDPQQRLFLQACWHSIEDAGYDARTLSGSRCGVFVGCAATDYHQLAPQRHLTAQGFTGNAMSILAARISYFLNLQGPSIAVDTACSSSLVALSHACDSLNSGGSDLALAGGVCVLAGPEMHIKAAQAGMLSPDGRCFTFDQRASGIVVGEGVGVVMLKRLADAERDGDIIRGVIRGWGLNQDGRTNGITAPNPESQTRLEQEVYDRYGIDPAGIQLIEAHGTATQLGDPIEVEGLKKAFARYTRKTGYCALGSIKSNIGHTLTAAGIAGVIKLVLALEHRQLPPTINFERLSEHIDLTGSPFFVNSRLREWKVDAGERRLAAISSFGFSGTNAHLVIGEYLPPASRTVPDAKTIVPLSARTAEQLKQKAVDLLVFLRKENVSIAEVAYTLQVGRAPMDERLGFIVSSIEQLAARLQAWVDDQPVDDVHRGQAKRSKESLGILSQDEEAVEMLVGRWIAQKKLSTLADVWTKGLDLDWNRLHDGVRPRRIRLPLYPFAKERYWIKAQPPREEASRPLFFQESWQEPAPADGPSDGANFVVFTDRQSALATGELAGARLVYRAAAYRKLSEREYHCRFNDADDIETLLDDVTSAGPLTIVYDWARGEQLAGIHALLSLFRAIRNHAVSHVILVGQYDPSRAETCWDYSWVGFERSLKRLLPKTRISVLYSESCTPGQLLDASRSGGVLWYQDGRRLALSFEPVELTRTSEEPVIKQGGTYLITGGAGALGLKFANYLAEHHRANLLLLGRSPLSPRIEEEIARLKAAGARDVRYDAVDVSDRSALASWARNHAISGVIHAAGVEPSGAFHERTAADVDSVLHPKTLGTLALDEVLGEQPLDFICYFSSIAASFGDDGACDYAVASRFQTAYALHRRQRTGNGRTIVINWPFWEDGGMGFRDLDQKARYLKMSAREFGNEPLPTRDGLDIWRDVLQSDQTQTMVVIGQPSRVDTFLRTLHHGRNDRYASKVEEVYSLVLPNVHSKMEYLTFCPFESRRAGFSMSATYLNPKAHAEDRRQVHAKQTEMRQVLFANEDFAEIESVLDFGCGHGTDVIQLGTLFPHLRVDGFTITADQARLGNQRIAARNLGSRVTIHHKDSARDPFPDQYDLVFGIEVCPHVENKESLFRNIRKSLTAEGTVLLMDIISNQQASAVDRSIGVHVPTQDEWLRVISGLRFRVDELIDVSPQIANFLYDPEVEQNVRNLPQAVRDTYRSYAELSEALEKGLISYLLVRLKGDDAADDQQLADHNRAALHDPTPYPAALEAMLRRPHVDYPRADDEPEPLVAETPRPSVAVSMPSAGHEHLQEELRTSLAAVLHMSASGIDVDQPFSELGLDSFLGLEWINSINATFGTELPNILVYDYPSIRALASFLGPKLPAAPAPPVVVQERIPIRKSRSAKRGDAAEKIAIIGMSGRYPQADGLQEYWQNLAEGKNSVAEIPSHRWDAERYYDPDPSKADKSCSKWLGALDDVDCFDPLFFRLSPQEAVHIDPQHRLFLQEAYRAFEDAGYSGESLSAKKCGVYLGISMAEYASRLLQSGVRAASVTSNSFAIAAARIAYYLNLKGPAISVDTACSSSLVALHLASQALLSGETDMALAGGVTLWLTPESYLSMSQAGMLSPSGQCRAFDDGADGIVVGEGVGALVLKRLSDAQRDNDFIHGVILGSGVNQDGKTNGITAPSVNSQIELIRDVYARNGIDPETISYVETHGTGTKLGDPIELTALATVFQEKTARKNYCGLGSVKSNVGHTAAASGVASVQKVLLAMQHRTLVPTLHVRKETAHFDFAESPFYISRETKPWNVGAGSLRRAAVSSFGFSGTNAHVVIEEYPAHEQAAAPRGEVIVPLSARTAEQLRQKARDLLECVETSRPDLAELAYTLQVGRDAMDERLAFVVGSLDELRSKLTAFVEGGETDRHREGVAAVWTKGLKVDWNALWDDPKPRRVSLPTYPFAREHYWIDEPPVSGGDSQSIENIINQVGDELIETHEAVRLLKVLV